jgi:hypothetical protein
MSAYRHQSYAVGFTVSGNFPKQYGPVKRGGKTFYRKYRQELKNGKGLTWLDVLKENQAAMYEQLASITFKPLFTE